MSTKIENNFIRYGVKYSMEGYHRCEESGCVDEGICRCYTISNVNFLKVDLDSIISYIFSEYYSPKSDSYIREEKLNEILYSYNRLLDIYCINRILRINKVWEPKNWEFFWSSSYYGDEVDKACLVKSVFNSVICDLNKIDNLKSISEKISYLLTREYGYLIPGLADKKWKISQVSFDDIIFPQISHLSKVKKENKEIFETRTQIKGICKRDGDKLKVIDGYHRIWFSNSKIIKVIEIYD
jgi:hypothetical protein